MALLAGTAGCAVGAQKNAIEAVMANDAERARAFEATARALDEHPEYVDEFYAVARRHAATFDRFIVDTTRDLRDPALAREVAARLVESPAALEQTMIAAVEAGEPRPHARTAMLAAMRKTAPTLTAILASDPDTMKTLAGAMLRQQRRGSLADVLKSLGITK